MEYINICRRFVARSMEHTNRRCATNNRRVGEFLKIRNCGTSEKKFGILGLIYISRFGIIRLIFLEYFQIRNCETYFSEVWDSPEKNQKHFREFFFLFFLAIGVLQPIWGMPAKIWGV
jgi:hypothetical protein